MPARTVFREGIDSVQDTRLHPGEATPELLAMSQTYLRR